MLGQVGFPASLPSAHTNSILHPLTLNCAGGPKFAKPLEIDTCCMLLVHATGSQPAISNLQSCTDSFPGKLHPNQLPLGSFANKRTADICDFLVDWAKVARIADMVADDNLLHSVVGDGGPDGFLGQDRAC